MPAVVGWSPRAEEHFRQVLSDLYDVSPALAEAWSDELDYKLKLLETFPEMGKLAPKHGLYFYRQILVGRYRLRYVYINDVVTIASIYHQASNASD